MSIGIKEQETNINFGRGDAKAIIYTSDRTTMTKLNKLVGLQNTEWKLESVSRLAGGEVAGMTYSCPVQLISFRSKRIERNYTDEERQKIADRFRNK